MQGEPSAILQVQPTFGSGGCLTPTGGRSPVITRPRKHAEIVFELPPTLSKWTGTLQVSNRIANTL